MADATILLEDTVQIIELTDSDSGHVLELEVVGEASIEFLDAGTPGLSAYQVAVQNGYTGTEEEWAQLAGMPLFVQPTAPSYTQPYLWVQIGLGDGSDFTFWIEDGQ